MNADDSKPSKNTAACAAESDAQAKINLDATHDGFAQYIQANSSFPSLSASAKQQMLNQVSQQTQAQDNDYTWSQFFVRLTALAAVLLFCLMTFNQLRSSGKDSLSADANVAKVNSTSINAMQAEAAQIAMGSVMAPDLFTMMRQESMLTNKDSLFQYSLKGIVYAQ